MALNLDHVRVEPLSNAAHEQIRDMLAESRLRRLAAQMWADAIEGEDYDEADRIAEETASWFQPEGER